MKNLRKLVFELDDHIAKILVNIETLEQIHRKFTYVRQQTDLLNGSQTTVTYSNHTLIHLLDDLFFYTLVDLNDNYRTTSMLVEQVVNRIITYYEN